MLLLTIEEGLRDIFKAHKKLVLVLVLRYFISCCFENFFTWKYILCSNIYVARSFMLLNFNLGKCAWKFKVSLIWMVLIIHMNPARVLNCNLKTKLHFVYCSTYIFPAKLSSEDLWTNQFNLLDNVWTYISVIHKSFAIQWHNSNIVFTPSLLSSSNVSWKCVQNFLREVDFPPLCNPFHVSCKFANLYIFNDTCFDLRHDIVMPRFAFACTADGRKWILHTSNYHNPVWDNLTTSRIVQWRISMLLLPSAEQLHRNQSKIS